MPKIKAGSIITFSFIFTGVVFSALLSVAGWKYLWQRPLAVDLEGIAVFLITYLAASFLAFRLFHRIFPLPEGPVESNSRSEWIYGVYILQFLIFFYPLIFTQMVPVPMRRLFYGALGAKLGENSYPSGVIFDPQLVEVGNFCVLGFGSLLCPHIVKQGAVDHRKILLSDRVTLGVGVTVYGGSVIEEDSLILPHSVVNPGTYIPSGEVWGGCPAVKLKDRSRKRRAS